MILKVIRFVLMICLWAGTISIMTQPIYAQSQYSIKEMTPEVQAALDGRKNRYEKLRSLKEKGSVGENNHGYVQALSEDAQVQELVEAENKDRRFIYKTIEQQNSLENAMNTIEKVFAQVQRDKANPGDKIQLENGQWVSK